MSAHLLDQRLAGMLVRPLAHTCVTPNQMTLFGLTLALASAGLFAWAEGNAVHWGAGVFLVSRFVDHMDGELARLTDRSSRLGYYLDAWVGAAGYAALFGGIGVGLWRQGMGEWTLILAVVTGLATFINTALQLRIQALKDDAPPAYPSWGPFELEDAVYLIGPIVWLGWILPLFVAGCTGTILFLTLRTGAAVLRP